MSEVKPGSNPSPEGSDQTDENKPEEKFVPRRAYEDVTRDMHKNKQKAKELEAVVNELQAQLQAQEEAKMQEKEQWKELYEKREAELEQERQKAREKYNLYMKSVKIAALKQEIGSNVKDEYLSFANLDNIVVNDDGSIDKDTVREVANVFRKEHGQLIPQSGNENITGHAPGSGPAEKPPVNLKKLTTEQLMEMYAKQKAN